MTRFVQLALACVAAFAFVACAGDNNRRADEALPGATGTTGTAGTSADVDHKWIDDQLGDGDNEVRLGRLAQERGARADVRAFGALMVEKHTVAGTELKRIADRHNVKATDAERDEGNRRFERLSKLSGEEFDRAFLDAMIDDHQEAVRELEGKADDDDEHADVREWAAKNLPEVKSHLERAKDLRGRIDRY